MSPEEDRLARLARLMRALRAMSERLGAAWPMSLWVAEGIKQAEKWANEEGKR